MTQEDLNPAPITEEALFNDYAFSNDLIKLNPLQRENQ